MCRTKNKLFSSTFTFTTKENTKIHKFSITSPGKHNFSLNVQKVHAIKTSENMLSYGFLSRLFLTLYTNKVVYTLALTVFHPTCYRDTVVANTVQTVTCQ